MPLIKRYPNRKLYNTETKQYVTLEGIATLIRQGENVQVLDHTTGEDLTTLTLTQIIFEQEKKQSGFLPQTVLTGLVQAGGDTLSVLRRTLASPLGLFRQVDEEIERRIHLLIERGELSQEEGRRWRDKLLLYGNRLHESSSPNETDLAHLLQRYGIPSRDDLQHLFDQLEVLTEKLDEMSEDAETS